MTLLGVESMALNSLYRKGLSTRGDHPLLLYARHCLFYIKGSLGQARCEDAFTVCIVNIELFWQFPWFSRT